MSSNAHLQQVFEDLMSRFIINVPESEISDTDRICFQIEQAHWFYEDFIREDDRSLPGFSLKRFAAEMFQRCPLLKDFLVHSNVEEIYQRFLAYKMNIPVCGAILLNPALDKVLMVRGWTSSSSWTFPKGKINQDEEECSCAVREVLEETGFDCSSLIQPTVYIEVIMRGEQSNRLYIITNIPETTEFCPRTRKEIGDIKWHRLTDLPGYKQQGKKINKQEDLNTKYFMISKIVVELQKWLNRNKKSLRKKSVANHSEEFNSILDFSPESSSIIDQVSVARSLDQNQFSVGLLQPYGTLTKESTLSHNPPQTQHHASLLSILKPGNMATASALSESPATTIPNASILLGTSLTPPETVQTSIGDDIRSDLLRILRDEPKNVPDQVVPSKNLAETQKRVKSSIEPQRASSDTVKPANDKRKKRAETQNQKRQSDDTSVKILKRPQSDQQDAVECHGDTMANFKFNMGDLLKYFNR